ncbi:MAG: glucose 1-dehydrogenase [Deltaproteobacteria bacterium]|nr:glucose 1-dehydrogenase [Deltaproteobacteria bacterium]
MAGRLEGKVVVVTGAASGIGAETARVFVANGARVVVADFQEEAGAKVAAQLGERARFIRCDVTKEADVAAAVDLAVSAFGQLDVMVNNAGIVGAVGPIANTSAEQWDKTIAVLLRGVFLGMKHASRVMSPRKTGAILSIASTAGVVGGLGPHAYTAAKHAVVGLTKSVASELAPLGIRVNAVAPGNTVTAMTSSVITGDPNATAKTEQQIKAGSALGIAGMPSDIANALLYLASEEARYVTAHTLVVDAGQTSAIGRTVFHDAPNEVIREAGKREK